jgi:gamma-glutamylcyclotransferase (GGCT)/AIG2-like uncharacterized protein YtfP
MDKLFVYGTLKPGFPNHYILKNIGGDFVEASLFGYKFDRIWQKQTGYPGIVEGLSNEKINGFLFISEKLNKNWKVLDDFETKAYIRKKVSISLNNEKVNAYVYAININFDINNF